jgi:hypothetical protein
MIDKLFIAFWTLMVFTSIAWYAYLLFHVGIKGGWDIVRMIRVLSGRPVGPQPPSPKDQ